MTTMTVKDFVTLMKWKYSDEVEIRWDSSNRISYTGIAYEIPDYLLNRKVINVGLITGEDNIKIFID